MHLGVCGAPDYCANKVDQFCSRNAEEGGSWATKHYLHSQEKRRGVRCPMSTERRRHSPLSPTHLVFRSWTNPTSGFVGDVVDDSVGQEWSSLALRSVVASAVKAYESLSDSQIFESLKKFESPMSPHPRDRHVNLRNFCFCLKTKILRSTCLSDASIVLIW